MKTLILLLLYSGALSAQDNCNLSNLYEVITDYHQTNEKTKNIAQWLYADEINYGFFSHLKSEYDENLGLSYTFSVDFIEDFEGPQCKTLYIRYLCEGRGKVDHEIRNCEEIPDHI